MMAVFMFCLCDPGATAKETRSPISELSRGQPGKSRSAGQGEKPPALAEAVASSANDTAGATTSQALPPVLEPSRFFGAAAIGYAAAKAAPEIMALLFCYCGCDITDSHQTLLDCFATPHGVDCHICQEEAVLALKLKREGVSSTEIQRIIDEKYQDQYPFEEDSPRYQKYKANRLYAARASLGEKSAEKKTPGGQISNTPAGPDLPGGPADGLPAGPDAPADKPGSKWKPKLKPGRTHNSECCKGEHKEAKGQATQRVDEPTGKAGKR